MLARWGRIFSLETIKMLMADSTVTTELRCGANKHMRRSSNACSEFPFRVHREVPAGKYKLVRSFLGTRGGSWVDGHDFQILNPLWKDFPI